MAPYTYPVEWLSSRSSSPEIVSRRHPHPLLVELITAMGPGDELRKFNSPSKAWRKFAGRFGYALIRKGKPIGMVILRLN